MNDDRLRDALHAEAATVDASADAWDRLQMRLGHSDRSPSRAFLVGGVAVLTVVVLALGVAWARDPSRGSPANPLPHTPMPRRVFAITADGKPVIINSRTGDRVPADDNVVFTADRFIAVAPDGREIYFVYGENAACGDQEIVQFSFRDLTDFAANATEPVISPDGRYLAYLRPRTDCLGARGIVRQDRRTSESVTIPAPAGKAFVGLRWMPDSQQVLSRVVGAPPETDTPNTFIDFVGEPIRRLRIVGRVDLDGEPVPVNDLGFDVVDDDQIVWSGRGRGEVLESRSLDTFDRSRVLVRGPWRKRWLAGIDADPTGQHLLLIPRTTLYTWSRGDEQPKRLASDLRAAAWIPDDVPVVSRDLVSVAVSPSRVAWGEQVTVAWRSSDEPIESVIPDLQTLDLDYRPGGGSWRTTHELPVRYRDPTLREAALVPAPRSGAPQPRAFAARVRIPRSAPGRYRVCVPLQVVRDNGPARGEKACVPLRVLVP